MREHTESGHRLVAANARPKPMENERRPQGERKDSIASGRDADDNTKLRHGVQQHQIRLEVGQSRGNSRVLTLNGER